MDQPSNAARGADAPRAASDLTFDGIDENGTLLTERELFDLMWQASWKATMACQAQGYGAGHQVTKDSARAAAAEVYRAHRPPEFAEEPRWNGI